MKKGWLLGASLAIIMSLVVLAGCQGGTTTLSGFSTQQEGIWVSGQGEVETVPDIFNLSLGIEAREDTVDQAQTMAAVAMNQVMDTLKDNGVDEKDIQTQRFNISPITKWDRERDEQITTGYRVTNMVIAKIRILEHESYPLDYKAGIIIDAVARAGGDLTRINSMSFTIDDPAPYQETAREEAMADALSKAEQLAKLAGVTLGKPTYISESRQYQPPVYRDAVMEEVVSAPGAAPTPITPGEITVSATVQVTYAIIP